MGPLAHCLLISRLFVVLVELHLMECQDSRHVEVFPLSLLVNSFFKILKLNLKRFGSWGFGVLGFWGFGFRGKFAICSEKVCAVTFS